MKESEFWNLISAAHSADSTEEEKISGLRIRLEQLSPDELVYFQKHYDEQIRTAFSAELYAAAWIMYGFEVSCDSFRYFRDWLISQGMDVFESSVYEPDSLADLPRTEMPEAESFGYIASSVFEEKTGDELQRDFTMDRVPPDVRDWTAPELAALLPRLWQKYRGS